MHAKVERLFPPSITAQEAVHQILSTGSVEFCGGETVQMLHYLDARTPRDAIIVPGETRPGLWQGVASLFRASLIRPGIFRT
ncbi:hypothetical protein [Mesorhizobium sp.]|uniref:hypothetical protein n=1 Tax=Mesorhizobium sp. TaxID=1871066 RepID=UPI0011FC3C1E|nr:hypothetical protein [Mesorhizobium sp.]TIO10704.1 MAG: hypothetical protein E5X88_02725 [Mesorhizobium sp.]TIO35352.1 MAG: hypothetical protein E5X89_08835 [Mesorhizobium sp.]TIP13409.1 MAG: hypothetical protein E5X73_08210 [Mesorhizobium sp.]